MNQKVRVIETASALEQYMPLMHEANTLGTDTETEGLDQFTAQLRTLQMSTDNDALVIDCRKVGYKAVKELVGPVLSDPKKIKIFHNAKFDLKFIKHHLGIDVEGIFCTYLASVMIEAGLKQERGYHGLEQTLDRYTGIKITKDEQRSDWSGELSNSQLTYAANDANCLLPLREEMRKKIINLGLVRCAKLEFDAVLPTAWLELCGFYLNMDDWAKLADHNMEEALSIADEIYEELSPYIAQAGLFEPAKININSPAQVIEYFRMTGIPMPDSSREDILIPYAKKYPLVEKYLRYKKLAKHANSFGNAWTEYINEVTGRVHANFTQMEAKTGRYACSNPNLQQIPKENKYRNCFQAEDGNTLISGDYSQIELRILADLANDKFALESFAKGIDFHTAMGAKIAKKEVEDVTKDDRDLAKPVNFAIPYGAGRNRVAESARISMIEAENLINTYFDAVPNFKKWINLQKRRILVQNYTRSVSGRMAYFPFDENDFASRGKAQRNAVNMPIQGSSVDILKRALRVFYDRTVGMQDKIKLVNIVHDEINVEGPEDMKDEIAEILQSSMVDAGREYLQKVEVKVDIKTNRYWEKG